MKNFFCQIGPFLYKERTFIMNKRFVYLFAGILVLCCAGLLFSWSIFSSTIAEEFPSWNNRKLTTTYTFFTFFFCIGGFLSSVILKHVTCRVSYLAAAFCMLIGFFSAASAKNAIQLYVGYGVLCGLSTGILLNTTMTAVVSWFKNRTGFISGLLLMGEGIGSFIIGKTFQEICIINEYSWRHAFKTFGIVFTIILILASFFIYVNSDKTALSKKEIPNCYLNIPPQLMLRKKSFQLFFCLVVLQTFAGLAFLSQAQGMIIQITSMAPTEEIAVIIGILSVCNSLGVLIIGGLFDILRYYHTILLTAVGYVFGAVITFLSIYISNISLLICGFIIFGIFFGGGNALNTAVILKLYGSTHYSGNYAVLNFNMLISSLGGLTAGVLIDLFGNYLFLLMGIVFFGIVSLLLGFLMKTP